ncbi:MAG: DUF2155 domain-containing protein [Rhodobacteraceae bacterium]|nr:DUF2155 domain-containing protein [Paracoccaceae bacterium]
MFVCATPLVAQTAASGTGAVLRGLDKVSGDVSDLTLPIGASAPFFGFRVVVRDCRFPAGNPTGDAYAYLEIGTLADDTPVFQGWMIASSPALNALDHARYDVWVLRCSND